MMTSPAALPGPRAFVARAASALAERGSVVLHLPRNPPEWLLPTLEEAVREATGVRCVSLDVAAGLRGRAPAHVIASRVMPGATRIRTVAALVAEPEVADVAFIVQGVPAGEWDAWLTFRRAFDRERARRGSGLMPFLLFSAPPGPPPQDANALPWLGCTGRLDVEMAAVALIGAPPPGDLVAATDLAVAVEVAGWDTGLLEVFAALNPTDRMDPNALVRHLGSAAPGVEATWAGGGLDLWDGDPLEHAAIIARRGDEESMAGRVLHGQIRVVFPFLDRVRRSAVARDVRRLQPLLPFTRPWGDGRTIAEAARLEFKDLLHLLPRLPAPEATFLKLCYQVRNKLAHGTPSKREDIAALDAGWRRLKTAFSVTCQGWRTC